MNQGERVKEPREMNDKHAQFHWAEGNKFALEFCKSLFLFNSTLAVSLIAYTASISKIQLSSDTWHHRAAIFSFLISAALAIITFFLGYLINLQHGNSYKQKTYAEYDRVWRSANRIQIASYVLLVLVLAAMGFGLHQLYIAFS